MDVPQISVQLRKVYCLNQIQCHLGSGGGSKFDGFSVFEMYRLVCNKHGIFVSSMHHWCLFPAAVQSLCIVRNALSPISHKIIDFLKSDLLILIEICFSDYSFQKEICKHAMLFFRIPTTHLIVFCACYYCEVILCCYRIVYLN